MKYLDKIIIIPECLYVIDNVVYNNFLDAVLNLNSNDILNHFYIIRIINPNATDIHPDVLNCTNLDSKNNLCIYAKNRYIYISIDKSEIYFEAFELKRSISDNWVCNFIYDYEFLYGNKIYERTFKAYSKIYERYFDIELDPIFIGGSFTSELSKEEALNFQYMNSGVYLKYL